MSDPKPAIAEILISLVAYPYNSGPVMTLVVSIKDQLATTMKVTISDSACNAFVLSFKVYCVGGRSNVYSDVALNVSCQQ